MDKRLAILNACIWGALAAVVFIVAITVTADLYLPLKDWLKWAFGHHWVGKGILAIGIFAVGTCIAYAISLRAEVQRIGSNLTLLMRISVAGTLALVFFFIYEAFFK